MLNTNLKCERWIAIEGCIYSEKEYQEKSDYGRKYKVRKSVAFNVGQEVAEHIVRLHNATVKGNTDD
jgi:hypothetical protein